jgi:hypothetical protein
MRLPHPDKSRLAMTERNDKIATLAFAKFAMTERRRKTKRNTKDGFPLSRE